MIQNHKFLRMGPGGRRCVCCFPAPGSTARKLECRRAKKRAKSEALRIEEREMLAE